MDLRRLQRVVVDALDDIKAQDIRVFNTTGQTELFDRVIIATGTSNRQTRSLAAHVREKVKEAGGSVISVEGSDTGEWVLVDLGDAVVHIMQPAIRAYYNLEEIWGAKPVRMQVARPPAGSRAASFARETDGVRAAVPTRPASAKPSTTRSAGNKPPADKPPAGKPPAKKSSAKKSSAKKSSANKPTANKPTAKRPAAKSPSARAPAAGASAAKRPTARKRKPASTR
jgi:ribosome-associated protein